MDNQREMFEKWYQQSPFAGEHRGFADYKHFAYAAWQAAIAAQWQPIETAPKVELKDLIVFNGEVQHGQWWEGYWINGFQEYMEPQPTMWHEMPAKP